MKLHLVAAEEALCNDGSKASYYLKKGDNIEKWIIFLQGGAYCFNENTCLQRWQSSPNLMSSKNLSLTRPASGILSPDNETNPLFHDYYAIFINYCSSDSHCGNHHSTGEGDWNFLGSKIVPSIIKEVGWLHGLNLAKNVIFTGSSAGAEGLLAHADRVPVILPGAKVVVLADSGWFMDSIPYKWQDCHDIQHCSESEGLKRGFSWNWEPVTNADCAAAKTRETYWECMMGYYAFPFIKTPFFVFQWRMDSVQMEKDGIHHKPASSAELKYAATSASNLTHTFELDGVHGVFSPSCYFHEILRAGHWRDVKVNGASLDAVFFDWMQDPSKKMWYIDECNTPDCNPTCL